MTTNERAYESYASTHAGLAHAVTHGHIYRRDIRPHLPAPAAGHRVLDIGCGQGELVACLAADGFDAYGVDISREQVEIAQRAGRDRVELGDFQEWLRPNTWDAVVATDLLEHLDRAEVLRTFDAVRAALRPGGVFIARVPNAVSPTGGMVMYGDITHQTWFTRLSVEQLAAVCGFAEIRVYPCPPPVHGVASALRAAVFRVFSAIVKAMLIAETGQRRGHLVTHNLSFVARSAPAAPASRSADVTADSAPASRSADVTADSAPASRSADGAADSAPGNAPPLSTSPAEVAATATGNGSVR